jgi:hypothetical protein
MMILKSDNNMDNLLIMRGKIFCDTMGTNGAAR